MPRRSRSRIAASEWQAGPMVQIIFARRAAGTWLGERDKGAGSWLEISFASSGLRIFNRLYTQSLGLLEELVVMLETRSLFENACPACQHGRSADPAFSLLSGATNGNEFFPQHSSREEHGVELRPHQDDQRNHVHPDQQGDGGAERSVNNAVVSGGFQIEA